jgi:hypothetical protein
MGSDCVIGMRMVCNMIDGVRVVVSDTVDGGRLSGVISVRLMQPLQGSLTDS